MNTELNTKLNTPTPRTDAPAALEEHDSLAIDATMKEGAK